MAEVPNMESEIKYWLENILESENLDNLSVKILGNSEKGEGYVGDVVFVLATGLTQNQTPKEYDLVLKCAKRSEALREKAPVQEAFLNEIYIYSTILPAFVKFQQEKGIAQPFNNIAKCYGSLVTDNMEIIAMENLKSIGYQVWDRKIPLTRKHIDSVIRQYAKLHAISVAMKDQQPHKFEDMAKKLIDVLAKFTELPGTPESFSSIIEEIHDLLKDDLDEKVLAKWKSFAQLPRYIFQKSSQIDGLKVILHGDCWNNNFMHCYNNNAVTGTIFIDWQMSRVSSPVLDLSYFLFAVISEEDIDDLDTIIRMYFDTFTNFVEQLGSNPNKFCSFEQFMDQWKKWAKFGICMVTLIHKYSFCEKDDILDLAKAAESDADISEAFKTPIKDTTALRKRMKYIVNYVATHDLI